MSVNRLNCEEYMADYLDGNLDPVLSAELMIFLSANPDLERQFRELESSHPLLLSKSVFCPGKEILKKDFTDVKAIDGSNFDEFCIAEIEGLLTGDDGQRLSRYISLHPERKGDVELFRQTILSPDFHITYPGKDQLKRHRVIRLLHRSPLYLLRMAAAVAALAMIIAINPGERSDTVGYADAFSAPEKESKKEAPDLMNIAGEMPHSLNSIPWTAGADKNSVSFPAADKTLAEIPLLMSIPAGLLDIPHAESPAMEKSLNFPSLIPENNELIAGLTTERIEDNGIPDLLGLIQKVDGWKTAGRVVKGFNYLTESQIKLNSTTDGKGKLSDLVITSEAFSIISHRNN